MRGLLWLLRCLGRRLWWLRVVPEPAVRPFAGYAVAAQPCARAVLSPALSVAAGLLRHRGFCCRFRGLLPLLPGGLLLRRCRCVHCSPPLRPCARGVGASGCCVADQLVSRPLREAVLSRLLPPRGHCCARRLPLVLLVLLRSLSRVAAPTGLQVG